ncbi:hypothetical protein, partial [Sphingobacterium sp. UBA1498]|uniref:hypothetical protein n=1 Tax=Sphingobacterium sp. UBA1498 TaxID=1947481 RepID=UPI0025CF9A84
QGLLSFNHLVAIDGAVVHRRCSVPILTRSGPSDSLLSMCNHSYFYQILANLVLIAFYYDEN